MAVRTPKRVWEVCEPHPDIYARDQDQSLFALSLHEVEAGVQSTDYTEPERFFEKTYMTGSMRGVLEGVMGRLSGKSGMGAPILRFETAFGGGKTHTMTALYHLAKYAEVLEKEEVGQRLMERLEMKRLPRDVRVVVLDGVALAQRFGEGGGRRTVWGELAWRLGEQEAYEAVRSSDEAMTPPGHAVVAELLARYQPVLILFDEVMHYLAKVRAQRVGDSSLMEQTLAFIRELTSAVNQTARTVLVVSLPASSLEIPVEDREKSEWLFSHLRKILGRTETIETPVSGDEVFGVLRKRLFRSVGEERVIRRIVSAFRSYYEEHSQFFDERYRTPSYIERMMNAYPFHPETTDLLCERWGPHQQFQRTRGALRLLSLVLRRLWYTRPSAYLIQPCNIDLSDRNIRAEVTRLVGEGFDSVITGDVVARAGEIERELGGDYERERLARGSATCAMLYSISHGGEIVGCSESEMRLALLRPGINPSLVAEVLSRLRERLWHLRYKKRKYAFTTKWNLNRVIMDWEEHITKEQIEEELAERLRKASGVGKGVLEVSLMPSTPEAVPDHARATLVILPLSLSDRGKAMEWMGKAVRRATNPNMLIFLAPEGGKEAKLRSCLRRILALEAIRGARDYDDLDREDRDEVNSKLRESQHQFKELVSGMYSRVYRPSGRDVVEADVRLIGEGETLMEAVEQALKEKGLLTDKLSPQFIKEFVRKKGGETTKAELYSVLTGSTDFPIVPRPDGALDDALRRGLEEKVLKVTVKGGKQTDRPLPFDTVIDIETAVITPPGRFRLELDASIRHRGYPLEKLMEMLRELGEDVEVEMDATGVIGVDSASKLIETLKGSEANVHLNIRFEFIAPDKKRHIEELMRDYSITHTWEELKEESGKSS